MRQTMTRKKKRPRRLRRPELTVKTILAWADAHHARTGAWPTKQNFHVYDNLDETWRRIDGALRKGLRGLPGEDSLAQLLDRERGVRNRKSLPQLSEDIIVRWARAHRRLAGRWPNEDAGPIVGTRGEVWINVAAALMIGFRGFPGGDSLARLLERCLGVPNPANRPRLTEQQVLGWADAYHARTGRWPRADVAPITEAPSETWCAIDDALRVGLRGLPGGSSLAKLLTEQRGMRSKRYAPRLEISHILSWAEAHRRQTGHWPGRGAGPIPEAPGETWNAVDLALQRGTRGLPGGQSLARLYHKRASRSRSVLR
jgi:hypothetical protein